MGAAGRERVRQYFSLDAFAASFNERALSERRALLQPYVERQALIREKAVSLQIDASAPERGRLLLGGKPSRIPGFSIDANAWLLQAVR